MNVLRIGYPDFSEKDRETVVRSYARTEHSKEDIIEAFYNGMRHRPEATIGSMNADVLADRDPTLQSRS